MKGLIPVAIVAVIVVGLVMAGFTFTGEVYVNTDGVGSKNHGIEGCSNDNGGGDLFDSTAYVTAWTGGGDSEKIVVSSHVRFYHYNWPLGLNLGWYQYRLSVAGNNPDVLINGVTTTQYTTEKIIPSFAIGEYGSWYVLEPWMFVLTNPTSGKVLIELIAYHSWNGGANHGTDTIATDQAYLRSGIGKVKVQNDVVEEGQTAHFFVETGYAHTSKASSNAEGWTLNIYNPGGTSVFSKTIGDNTAGTVDWSVPMGAYSPTSSNIYTVILRNALIDQDDDWFFTVGAGMLLQIPNQPSFKIADPHENYVSGDQIVVQITATRNPIGNDIAGFWVWVSYETSAGTTTNYLIEKAWYPATKVGEQFTARVTFTFPDAGHARFEASAADTQNLNSGIAELSWTVYKPGGQDTPGFDWKIIVIVGMIIFGIVAGILLIRKFFPWGIIIGAILLGAAAAGIWYVATVML